MHRLLRRQLKKHLGAEDEIPASLQPFLDAVDAAYADFDSDRAMLERSLELSSKELSDAHDEARQARRQLTDALESISEGFFLFDADDRLVVCNTRFKALYPGLADIVVPGVAFEDIIRAVARRAIVVDTVAHSEDWIRGRLEQHRNPSGSLLHRQNDGRWIQINERKTQDDGTVGVYTDVTELKESEQRTAAANRLILDSIRYASRIQNAILPARNALASASRDHFLIWEPRDVVGGDFFWFQPAQGGHVVMVGDCTGHGVPGAFMTLITCGLLDRIVQSVPPDEPSRVLGELHRGLQVLLGQDRGDGETDDGLEAGVCFISEAERRLVFSGARLSLWRTNGGPVDEIRGNRAGIGYRRFAHDTAFTDVPLELNDGSAFYLTTDGLIDQVGGPRRISFGKRRFAAFLAEHQARSMQEQAEALRQAVAAYQGGERRRDDLTVLGFTPRAA